MSRNDAVVGGPAEPRPTFSTLLSIVLVLVVVHSARARALNRIDLEEVLEKPLSPGSIALLTEHVQDTRAIDRLSEALRDPRAEIRSAAARVLYASGGKVLVGELEAALGKETDRASAQELVRAVIAFGGPDRSELALHAAERLDMASTVGMLLAAVEREKALRHLDRLRNMPAFDSLTSFLHVSSRTSFDFLAPLAARSLREPDVELWRAYLALARERGERVSDGHLVFTINAPTEELRLETLSFLLHELTRRRWLPPSVESVVEDRVAARGSVESVDEAFFLELIARSRGSDSTESSEWILMRREEQPTPLMFPTVRELALLTKDERRALSSQLQGDKDTFDRWLENRESVPRGLNEVMPSAKQPSRTAPVWSTVGGYPPGLVADLLRVTGCSPITGVHAAADASFSMDGRPIRIDAVQGEAIGGCSDAARALFLNYVLAPGDLSRTGAWEKLLILFSPDFLSCLEGATALHSREGRDIRATGEALDFPDLKKHPAPENPLAFVGAGSWAFVDLTAVISVSGCLRNIRVTDSLDPQHDFDSIETLSRWKFEPFVLDGVPVPRKGGIRVWFRGAGKVVPRRDQKRY